MSLEKPPLKIMIIIGSLDVGGTERHLCQLLPLLHGKNFEFTVVAIRQRGLLASKLDKVGIEVLCPVLPLWSKQLRLLNIFCAFVWLALLIRKRKPDIVHTFLPTAYILGGLCATLLKVPIRVMSRRSLNLYQESHPISKKLEYWLHRKMHMLIGNSMAVVAELRQETVSSTGRIQLILNGIDTSPFQHAKSSVQVRSQLKVPQGALLILCIANLIPYKGHSDLLEALFEIHPQLPDPWRLLCIGRDDGPLEKLQEKTKQFKLDNNVVWLGPRSDVPDLLCAGDIGVLPSHQEGLSNAVLEGMAAGIPMVVTNTGGNPELVVHGKSGLLVPVKAPRKLGEAILMLAHDKNMRSTMGAAARERQTKHFSLDACVSGYRSAYTSLHLKTGTTTNL